MSCTYCSILPIFWIMLVFIFRLNQAIEYPNYPQCNDTSLNNQGLYFVERDGTRVWNHCRFPNPRTYPSTCGRDARFGDVYDLCNIDQIIDSADLYELDAILEKVGAETSNRCLVNSVKINTTVSLVAVDHIRTTSLADQENVCVNDCGEYFPELVNTTTATPQEIQFAVDIFAQRLADSWGTILCDATVAVVYWHGQKTIGTGVPTLLQGKLKWEEVLEIRTKAQELYFSRNDSYVTEGLVYVLNEYNRQLKDTPPALYLLCIMFLIMILLFSLLLWQFLSNGISDQFDDNLVVDFLGLLFRIVTGVFVFEVLMRCMLYMDRVLAWWHVLLLAVFVTAVFVFIIFVTVFVNP